MQREARAWMKQRSAFMIAYNISRSVVDTAEAICTVVEWSTLRVISVEEDGERWVYAERSGGATSVDDEMGSLMASTALYIAAAGMFAKAAAWLGLNFLWPDRCPVDPVPRSLGTWLAQRPHRSNLQRAKM